MPKTNQLSADQAPPAISSDLRSRIAVCSWSLQPESPHDLVAKLQATRISRVQLALDPLRASPSVWNSTGELLAAAGCSIVSGMFGCVGEDYTTLESIRATGGIVPAATWEENLRNIRATVPLAARLGLKLVTFHAGFIPHDPADPAVRQLLDRLATVADLFAREKIALGLETGQESAPDLASLLRTLDHPNVGVNFDPANMILYGKGNPIEAMRVLRPWIRQVHIKDATPTRVPGTWGEEVAAGTGEVDWPAFFSTLNELQYTGDFVIEREAGGQCIIDIQAACDVCLRLAQPSA